MNTMRYDVERYNGSEFETVCSFWDREQACKTSLKFNTCVKTQQYRVRAYREES